MVSFPNSQYQAGRFSKKAPFFSPQVSLEQSQEETARGQSALLNLAVVSRWRPKIERKTMKISRHWRIHSAREELAFTSHTTSSSMLGSCRVGWCLTWLQSLPPSSQSLQPPAGLGSNMPNFTRLPCFKTKPFATGDSHFSIGPLSSSNLRVENITLWELYAMKTIAY